MRTKGGEKEGRMNGMEEMEKGGEDGGGGKEGNKATDDKMISEKE